MYPQVPEIRYSNETSRADSSLDQTVEDNCQRKQDESSESEVDTGSEDTGEEFEESHVYNRKTPELINRQPPKLKASVNNPNNQWPSPIYIALILISSLSLVVLPLMISTSETEASSFHLIQENFPTQKDDLWLSFETGVDDVITRNRPSTFVFLYQEEAEDTLMKLLQDLTKYAVCNIRDCSKKPIILSDTELNSPQVIRNYGSLIEKYRDKLSENGVMIIRNLENVRGVSAQAFHTFCDEFTPLVEKSVFIFTMKVKELPGPNSMKFVEEYFRKKWTDIKIDTFNALITRITSMVVEVMP
ncbi:uncharacterized protein LOC123015929 isoform X2 [Tribolium madens]|uniref:uncharacterized protein LOC123015929 isoform X2 n=1 Tax=Tribolium madens TaxID=41895 RepID=UPI001CF76615|nr:uncharacterized protein LOC123015929 isoform X2 [Tribolium madens]